MSARDARLLVAHVVYRFDVGGLENGVVNLLNRLPAERFRHAVVALTEVTDFRRRVLRDDVQYFRLEQASGSRRRSCGPRCIALFRALRPDIVHTRNLAPLEACVPAWLAGVPVRVHGEHGWDVGDLDGSNRASPHHAAPLPAFRYALHRALTPHRGLPAAADRSPVRTNLADLQRCRSAALRGTGDDEGADRRFAVQ